MFLSPKPCSIPIYTTLASNSYIPPTFSLDNVFLMILVSSINLLEKTCPYRSSQLDPLGQHALTCHYAGDVVTRHNCIRDCIADFCGCAHLSPLMEQGCGIGPAKDRSRPADILIPNWSLSRSAAFDIKVIHSLDYSLISDAGQTSVASAAVGKQEK